MSDRPCVRGCTVPGVHYATCPDFGNTEGQCGGCAPRVARDQAMICERCYRRLRRLINTAPDLIGVLRSRADPMKATAIGKPSGRRQELPAPVEASLIDAADDVMRTLRTWAVYAEDGIMPSRTRGMRAGAATDDAYTAARDCADLILDRLDGFVNNEQLVLRLGADFLDSFTPAGPGDEPGFWSVAMVASRWPLGDRPRWADRPCPDCDMLTVRVTPARGAAPGSYECAACGWEADDTDDGGLWADAFTPEPVPSQHEPRWLTLAAAARTAGRTPGTVRRWAQTGEVSMEAGRYWRPDVEAAVARRDETYGDVDHLFSGDHAHGDGATDRGEWTVVDRNMIRRADLTARDEDGEASERHAGE